MRFSKLNRLFLPIVIVSAALSIGCRLLPPPAERVMLEVAEKRRRAPDFVATDTNRTQFRLSAYKGKVVLLKFWATWCKPCDDERPTLVDLEAKYGHRGFAVLGVALDRAGLRVVEPYVVSQKITFRVICCDDQVTERFGMSREPATIFIDRNGMIAAAAAGILSKQVYEDVIGRLL
jgi:cytochrome c biogenesis protein CcmG, thiol:disulfide interchange protein DsbE